MSPAGVCLAGGIRFWRDAQEELLPDWYLRFSGKFCRSDSHAF